MADIIDGSHWPPWVCPEHSLPLAYQTGALVCSRGHEFPCRNDIPRFAAPSYSEAFGLQWNVYRKTQLDSYTGTTITQDRIHRVLGDTIFAGLEDKQVLECGCGAGRFTETRLAQGARVTSIDMSTAVEANVKNFPQSQAHRAAQADIQSLPFAPQQYDLVLALGVIQHMPSPEDAVAALYSHVKPGGYLVLDHYTYNMSWYTKSAPIFRSIIRKLPSHRALAITQRIVDRLLPWHRRATRISGVLQIMLSRLSPVQCYYTTYPQLNDKLQREWALLDTFDSLTTLHHHFRTRGGVHRMLERLGMTSIRTKYDGNGVEACGKRPIQVGHER